MNIKEEYNFCGDFIKKDDIQVKVSKNNGDIKRVYTIENIHYINNKEWLEEDTSTFMDDLSELLIDEYQWLNLNKINFIKKYDNIDLNDDESVWYNKIKERYIPIVMGIIEKNNIMKYHHILNILPKGEEVMIVRGIDSTDIRNRRLELYSVLDSYLKNMNECKVLNVYYTFENGLKYTKIEKKNLDDYIILKNRRELVTKKKNFILYEFCVEQRDQVDYIYKIVKIISMGLDNLERDGSIFIQFEFLPIYLPYMEIIYLLSTMFNEMISIKGEIEENNYKNIGFGLRGYKNVNILNEVVKNYLRENYKMNNMVKIRNSNNIVKYNYVESILKNRKMNSQFKMYMNRIYRRINENYKNNMMKKEFVKNELIRNPLLIDKFINYDIKRAYDWCKKNDIIINPIYNIQYELRSIKERLFGRDIQTDRILISHESVYSTTGYREAQYISNIIKKYFQNTKIIIDATANIGGNTINFGKNFEKVYSYEIDENTYNMLKNNVEVMGLQNVECIHGDYVENKDNIKGDVYYFDPPWGGIYYKVEPKMDLYLSGVNIIDILPKKFVLKAPKNYNIEGLMTKFRKLLVFDLKNFIIIIPNTDFLQNT